MKYYYSYKQYLHCPAATEVSKDRAHIRTILGLIGFIMFILGIGGVILSFNFKTINYDYLFAVVFVILGILIYIYIFARFEKETKRQINEAFENSFDYHYFRVSSLLENSKIPAAQLSIDTYLTCKFQKKSTVLKNNTQTILETVILTSFILSKICKNGIDNSDKKRQFFYDYTDSLSIIISNDYSMSVSEVQSLMTIRYNYYEETRKNSTNKVKALSNATLKVINKYNDNTSKNTNSSSIENYINTIKPLFSDTVISIIAYYNNDKSGAVK